MKIVPQDLSYDMIVDLKRLVEMYGDDSQRFLKTNPKKLRRQLKGIISRGDRSNVPRRAESQRQCRWRKRLQEERNLPTQKTIMMFVKKNK